MVHLGARNLEKLVDVLVTEISLSAEYDAADCRVCPMGKQSNGPFPKGGSRVSEVLKLVHLDISGVEWYGGEFDRWKPAVHYIH